MNTVRFIKFAACFRIVYLIPRKNPSYANGNEILYHKWVDISLKLKHGAQVLNVTNLHIYWE